MIYLQKHIKEADKIVIENHEIDMTLEQGITYAKQFLQKDAFMVYLKEDTTDSLLEITYIDGTLIVSYILDLFDFIKNFKND